MTEKKSLRLGKMKGKEIAEWFGIAASTFSAHKSDKLEELRIYAEFEDLGGKGVNITKIIEPYYSKKMSEAKKIIYDAFDETWDESGLDTVSNVTLKIWEKYSELLPIQSNTAYNYGLDARNLLYGKPYVTVGEKGTCIYVWGKVVYDDGMNLHYLPLTEDEVAKKQKLMKKYFGTNEEKDVMIAEMVEDGEITKEEAYDLMVEYRGLNKAGYGKFIKELSKEVGAPVTEVTFRQRKEEVIGEEESLLLNYQN